MSYLPRSKVRARQIGDSDVDGVVALLANGFQLRDRKYWQCALAALKDHPTPSGFPKYGYMLECDGAPVGVILLIFSSIPSNGSTMIRCNVSSWYVEPAFRSQASMLIAHAIKHKNVTYVNVSPAMHTRPIIEAQGFSRYSSGQFVTAPLLGQAHRGADVVEVGAEPDATDDSAERELLLQHKRRGCLGLWCVDGGRAYPFVFMPRRVKGIIPCVQLIYCRDIADFVRLARPLGRELMYRGKPLVIIDSNGPIPGLFGRYVDGKSPKYFKGPNCPTLGDLAFTESVMFGL